LYKEIFEGETQEDGPNSTTRLILWGILWYLQILALRRRQSCFTCYL